jgi:hypothetical protein
MSSTVNDIAVEPDLVDWQRRFLDIVCADEELTRAEFDEIISAGWDTPTPPRRPTSGGFPPGNGPAGSTRAGTASLPRGRQVVPPAMRRQRSPPR